VVSVINLSNQKPNFKLETIQEVKILELLDIINLEKKGLDQEYYIIELPIVLRYK